MIAAINGCGRLSMRFSMFICMAAMLLSACSSNMHEPRVGAGVATSPTAAAYTTSQKNTPPSPKAAADDRTIMIDRFVKQLAYIANAGSLSDVDATMHTIGIGYRAETVEKSTSPVDCSVGWHPKQQQKTTVFADDQSWYRPTRFGVPNLLEPTVVWSIPSIQYVVTHIVRCMDQVPSQDSTEAQITFNTLPEYICITESDIRHALPGAHRTGGGMTIEYFGDKGRLNDDIGAHFAFIFESSSRCALQAEITQTYTVGFRYKRAVWKHLRCVAENEVDYCVAHGGFKISQADLRGIDAYVDARCPSIEALYLKEPHSGETPPNDSFGRPLSAPFNPCRF